MSGDNEYLQIQFSRERLGHRGSRTFGLLVAVSFLALIPFECFQGFPRYDGRSMLSKQSFNESAQIESFMNATVTVLPSSHTSPRKMYHTPSELRRIYSGKRVLWVGDSTGRRAAMNLYALLEWKNSNFLPGDLSSPTLIDAAKQGPHECDKWIEADFRPHLCRAVNFTTEGGTLGEHIYSKVVCHTGVELFFQNEMEGRANITKDVDLIVVSVGIWDVIKPFACREGLNNRTLTQVISDAIDRTNEFQIASGIPVIWRTSGYSEQRKAIIDKTSALNEASMDKIDQVRANNTLDGLPNRFSYVNWGGARIKGDMKPHYGLEPRHVLIEMITNHVEDEGYFSNTSLSS